MTTILQPPPCMACKHMGKGRHCAAYTKTPIPVAIWTSREPHDQLRGDEDVKLTYQAKGKAAA